VPKKKMKALNEGLPSGLAQPAVRALNGAGFFKLSQLTKATETELLELHGMGPNAMKKIKEALKKAGLTFAKSGKA
jgi:hypothetical protein